MDMKLVIVKSWASAFSRRLLGEIPRLGYFLDNPRNLGTVFLLSRKLNKVPRLWLGLVSACGPVFKTIKSKKVWNLNRRAIPKFPVLRWLVSFLSVLLCCRIIFLGQAGEHLLFPSSKFTEKIMLDYYGDFLDVLMEKKCFRYIPFLLIVLSVE